MSLLDKTLSIIAPHQCVGCGIAGSALCAVCQLSAGEMPPPRCGGGRKLSDGYRTCSVCRQWLKIYAVYVATYYEGPCEKLLHAYKFGHKQQAADSIAAIMRQVSVDIDDDSALLCPIPTAPARRRRRGFDHAKLLARAYWKKLPSHMQSHLRLQSLLVRRTNTRQLGASRTQRIKQMQDEFVLQKDVNVKDRTVLLIDDVVTTGATLAAAATTLRKEGAKRVYAIVYAQKG